jgi:hypothetical protein
MVSSRSRKYGSPVTVLDPDFLAVASIIESAIHQSFTLFFLSKLISV